MIELGVIIKQEESTPWVNSITIVRKPGKIKICLDLTKFNKAILHGPSLLWTIEEVVAKIHGSNYFRFWMPTLDIGKYN